MNEVVRTLPDGKPRAPYQLNYAAYLLDPEDGSAYTSINSTTGQRIAVEELGEKVRRMRALRGSRVVPVVTLDSAIMKTKYGAKMRPEFKVVEWRELGGPANPPAITPEPVRQLPPIVNRCPASRSHGPLRPISSTTRFRFREPQDG